MHLRRYVRALRTETTRLGTPLLAGVTSLLTGLGDLLYPPRCLHCSARPERPSLPLCPTCLQRLEAASVADVEARIQTLPASGREAVDAARALWTFDKKGALQAVQHAVKYGDRPRYGPPLGRLMASGLRRDGITDQMGPVTGVVPIPLHRTRMLERGFNQAAMLAEGIAEALRRPLRTRLLVRPRATQSQTDLSKAQRWANVRQAFDVQGEAAGTWLLVDDVLTTGSTCGAAAHALKAAGASTVIVCTLALARA